MEIRFTAPATAGTATRTLLEEELAEEASARCDYDGLADWLAERALRNWCFLLTVRIGLERWKWRAVHKCWSPPDGAGYRSLKREWEREAHASPPNYSKRQRAGRE